MAIAGVPYGIPNDAVVAREHTQKVSCYVGCPDFAASVELHRILLTRLQYTPGGPYRRVNYDGTLGPPVTEVQIRGSERHHSGEGG